MWWCYFFLNMHVCSLFLLLYFFVVVSIAIDNTVYRCSNPFYYCCFTITFAYFVYIFIPFHPVFAENTGYMASLGPVIRYFALLYRHKLCACVCLCVFLCRHSPEIYENFNLQYWTTYKCISYSRIVSNVD